MQRCRLWLRGGARVVERLRPAGRAAEQLARRSRPPFVQRIVPSRRWGSASSTSPPADATQSEATISVAAWPADGHGHDCLYGATHHRGQPAVFHDAHAGADAVATGGGHATIPPGWTGGGGQRATAHARQGGVRYDRSGAPGACQLSGRPTGPVSRGPERAAIQSGGGARQARRELHAGGSAAHGRGQPRRPRAADDVGGSGEGLVSPIKARHDSTKRMPPDGQSSRRLCRRGRSRFGHFCRASSSFPSAALSRKATKTAANVAVHDDRAAADANGGRRARAQHRIATTTDAALDSIPVEAVIEPHGDLLHQPHQVARRRSADVGHRPRRRPQKVDARLGVPRTLQLVLATTLGLTRLPPRCHKREAQWEGSRSCPRETTNEGLPSAGRQPETADKIEIGANVWRARALVLVMRRGAPWGRFGSSPKRHAPSARLCYATPSLPPCTAWLSIRMGRLLRIELENFKSYAGKVTVGPFPPGFSAVIGPNGGGKSNLMDAISFVLGLPSRQLRGGFLGDMVYRGNLAAGEAYTFLAEEPAPQSAVVRLVYEHEPDRETVFSRTVTVSGVSTYRVDSRAVSLETYLRRLQAVHLSAGPQSFLVFQNQVEEIANRSPQQLAALFEETSNSVELRDEYERLRQRLEAAQQEAAFCLQKKRGMLAERKQYREQQDEVERYQTLEQRLAQTRTERMLFRLFHVERDLNERHTESVALADEVTRLQQEHASIGDAVEQHKKELARCRKAQAALEKQITQLRSAQEQTAAAVAGTQAQVQQLTKRTAADRQRLTEAERSAHEARSELQLLQTAMRDVEEAMRTLEREEQQRRQSESGARLDAARLAALQEAAARRTASLQEELAAAERTALVASQALNAAERTMRNVAQQAAETEREWEQQRQRYQTLEDRAREEERTAQRLTAENESNQRRAAERAAQRRELEHIVEQCSEALRAAKAERVESAREQRLSEAVTTMRRLFPGVRGRIADLCRPVQRKYHEAVAVALGKSMGAIVVDTEDTAGECIAYLKEQRAGTATFIPLREIRAPTVQAALRSLGGTARLLIDVLQFDRSIAAAVQYVAGNTVVCDTLDEARRIAYAAGSDAGAGDARKVCTVDGTLIHRSGFITGGADDSASGGGASRWDEAETEALRRRRQQALEKLAELAAGSALHERARDQEL
eukprot:ctg_3037.g592